MTHHDDPTVRLLVRVRRIEDIMRKGRIVHMTGAAVTGFLFFWAPSAGPTFTLLSLLPGWPVILAAPLLAAAVAAIIAQRRARCQDRAISIALRVCAWWYLVVGAMFVAVWVAWVVGWALPEGQVAPAPAVYPVGVYGTLGTLLLLHVSALEHLGSTEDC